MLRIALAAALLLLAPTAAGAYGGGFSDGTDDFRDTDNNPVLEGPPVADIRRVAVEDDGQTRAILVTLGERRTSTGPEGPAYNLTIDVEGDGVPEIRFWSNLADGFFGTERVRWVDFPRSRDGTNLVFLLKDEAGKITPETLPTGEWHMRIESTMVVDGRIVHDIAEGVLEEPARAAPGAGPVQWVVAALAAILVASRSRIA